MKICIPTETKDGLKAQVYGHFGSAPFFTIFDTEKKKTEIIENSNEHHVHGTCHPISVIGDKKIDAVVCAGMGARAVMMLNAGGVKAYRVSGGTVASIVKEYEKGELEEINADNACAKHGCH